MHVFRSNTLPTYKLRCSFYGQAKRKPSWPPKTPKDTKTTSHRLLISIQGSPFVASRVFRGPASLVAALPRCVYPWLAVPAVPLASLRLGVRNFRKFFAAESHRENSWGASPGEGLGRAVQPLGWLFRLSPYFVLFVCFVVSAVGLFPPCPLWLCESKSGTHVLTEAQRHRGRIRNGTRTSGDAFPPDRNPVILSKIV